MSQKRGEVAKIQVTSLNADVLRIIQKGINETFQDVEFSPFYPRDKGRPGWIFWGTFYKIPVDKNAPQVTQLQLPTEAE